MNNHSENMHLHCRSLVQASRSLIATLAGPVVLLSAFAVLAEPFDSSNWSTSAAALLAAQAPEDTKGLLPIIETTRPIACTVGRNLSISEIDRMLMIRLSHGYTTTWFLYQTRDESVITKLVSKYANSVFSSRSSIVESAEWDRVFTKFSAHYQRPPTPENNEELKHGRVWPRGYVAIANVFDRQKTREYLLATDDVRTLHVKSPVHKSLCSTVFAGLHCQTGAEVTQGWVLNELEGLLQDPSAKPLRPFDAPTSKLVQFSTNPSIDPACRLSE